MGEETKNLNVGVRMTEDQHQRLERVAYEKSEPGSQVSVSEVIREAIDEYLQTWEDADEPLDDKAKTEPVDA